MSKLLLQIAFLFAITASLAMAQDSHGSQEALKETPMKIPDEETGATILVYPSVLNEARIQQEQWSALRFYVAPLCVLVRHPPYKPQVRGSGKVEYVLQVRWGNLASIRQQVEPWLTRQFGRNVVAHGASVSAMTHQRVSFVFPGRPEFHIEPIGTSSTDVVLPENAKIRVEVPEAARTDFEAYLETGGLQLEVRVEYGSKDLSQLSISWSAQDIRDTESYKNAISGGARFVAAEQVHEMMRQVATSKSVLVFQDPQVDRDLRDAAFKFIEELVDIQTEIAIRSSTDIEQLEAMALRGLGLDPAALMPIVNLWEVADSVRDSAHHRQANENIRNWANNRKKKKGWDLSVSGTYKAFTGSLGYENGWSANDVESGLVKSDEQLASFREVTHSKSGARPVITARGLKVVEATLLNSNLSHLARAQTIVPRDRAKELAIPMTVISAEDVTARADRFRAAYYALNQPVGTILAFAGITVPEGWLLCDGSIYAASDYPALALVMGSRPGPGAKATFIVPDLRGRFLLGEGKSGANVYRHLATGGEEVHLLTVAEMPAHGHHVNDRGHSHTVYYGLNNNDGSKDQAHEVHAPTAAQGEEGTSSSKSNLSIEQTGGNRPHNNMPPYLAVKYVIKAR